MSAKIEEPLELTLQRNSGHATTAERKRVLVFFIQGSEMAETRPNRRPRLAATNDPSVFRISGGYSKVHFRVNCPLSLCVQ